MADRAKPTCRKCGAEIIFAKCVFNREVKFVPLDPEPLKEFFPKEDLFLCNQHLEGVKVHFAEPCKTYRGHKCRAETQEPYIPQYKEVINKDPQEVDPDSDVGF